MCLCSCRKFETFDILCQRALKFFDVLEFKLIPGEYIIKRWKRDARDEKDFTKKDIESDIQLEYANRYRALCPKYIQLGMKHVKLKNVLIFSMRLL
jgi:hypothetical protein